MTRPDEAEETATAAESRRSEDAAAVERGPHLFIALHCDAPHLGGARYSLAKLDEVVVTRASSRSAEREETPDGRVLTLRVPGTFVSRGHARFKRVRDAWLVVDDGSTNGVFVGQRRVDRATLADGDVIECGRTLLVFRAALPSPRGTPADAEPAPDDARLRLATLLPELGASHDALAKIAASALPLLLLGESGSGKEVAARAVHALSGRPGAFVAMNCGAIPDGLVEAQLFGHVKGAFSGATRDEPGFFRAAHGGTLFLPAVVVDRIPRTTRRRTHAPSAISPAGRASSATWRSRSPSCRRCAGRR